MARGRRRRSSKRLPPLAVLVLLLVGGALVYLRERWEPAPAYVPGEQVRLATWNLKKFSEGSRPDLVTIAKVIQEENFELVAIQEVQQQGQAVQRLRRQLNEPWRHVISPPAGDGERFAYLYRADRLELLGEPALMSEPEAPVFARTPYIATFRSGQFDFVLVNVHLSWGDTERRRRESEALARFARDMAARSPEKDIILVGDFNEQTSRPNMRYFEAAGWTALNREPTNLSSKEVYDNLLVNRQHTREFTGRVGVIRFDETLFDNDDKRASDEVSDHRPVYADFHTTGPDDD